MHRVTSVFEWQPACSSLLSLLSASFLLLDYESYLSWIPSRWSEHESLGASRTAICHALTLHNELPLDLSRKWWRIILSIRNLPEWSQISHLCIVQRSVIFWAFGHPTTAKTKCTWLARHDKTTNKCVTQVHEPSTIGTDKRVFPLTKILWLWNNIPQRKCTHF